MTYKGDAEKAPYLPFCGYLKKNYMFNNGLQILQPTWEKRQYSNVSYFFVLTTVAGFYTNCICTCPKGNMQGQSPIRNVTGNI